MKVLITGAGGFLGRALVVHAVAAGHDVGALLVRPASASAARAFDPAVTVVQGDLRSRGDWCDVLGRIDVVIHAAAAASGSRSWQLVPWWRPERLLGALGEEPAEPVRASARCPSTTSMRCAEHRSTKVHRSNHAARRRDAYTEAKLVQERLVREWCQARGVRA